MSQQATTMAAINSLRITHPRTTNGITGHSGRFSELITIGMRTGITRG
jgi:hypothetical protein